MEKLFVDKSIEINAPVKKVWEVLTEPEFAKQWVAEGWGKSEDVEKGMTIFSEWKLNSEVLWKDKDENVLVKGNVTALDPNKLLRFTALDVRSAEKFPVTKEDGITYELTEQNGETTLRIRQGDFSVMSNGEKYFQETAKVWDRALPKVKELAEVNKQEMEEQPTCGKGLAENSSLPAKLGELIASMAENLELHMKALDLNDHDSKREFDAYKKLAGKHREIALELATTAKEMAAYSDLPMGRHDMKKMSDPKVSEVFAKFTNTERELLTLLKKRVEKDEQMLLKMRKLN